MAAGRRAGRGLRRPVAATPRCGSTRARSSSWRWPTRMGVGVRVVREGRQGFAYCGTFDADALAETVAEARDNAAFAEPDEAAGLAEPDGVEPVELDLWRPGLAGVPTDRQGGAGRRAGAGGAGRRPPHRRRRVVRLRRLAGRGRRRDHHRHPPQRPARPAASWSAYSLAADGDDAQTGFGFSLGRAFDELDVDGRGPRRRRPGRCACWAPPSRRRAGSPSCSTPGSPPSSSASWPARSAAEEVIKGRSLFADRVGEQVASPLVTLVEDPTDAPVVGRHRRSTTRAWPPGAVPLVDAGVLGGLRPLDLDRPPHGHGLDRLGGAGRVQVDARRPGAGPWRSRPGTAPPADAARRRRRRRAGAGGLGPALGRQPGLAATSRPAPRACASGAASWPSRCREFTIASTLQRLLHDVAAVGADLTWLPMSAAGVTPRRRRRRGLRLVSGTRDGGHASEDELLDLAAKVAGRGRRGRAGRGVRRQLDLDSRSGSTAARSSR